MGIYSERIIMPEGDVEQPPGEVMSVEVHAKDLDEGHRYFIVSRTAGDIYTGSFVKYAPTKIPGKPNNISKYIDFPKFDRVERFNGAGPPGVKRQIMVSRYAFSFYEAEEDPSTPGGRRRARKTRRRHK